MTRLNNTSKKTKAAVKVFIHNFQTVIQNANNVSTSNHMFGRAIWDEFPECIFESASRQL